MEAHSRIRHVNEDDMPQELQDLRNTYISIGEAWKRKTLHEHFKNSKRKVIIWQ